MHPLIRQAGDYLTRRLDGVLLSLIVTLMAVGLATLISASNLSPARVTGQLANMLFALGLLWVFANIPPHFLARLALPLYCFGVLLLVAVALGGERVHGAKRWLDVGVTRIQPSELMKIAIPLAMAWYFDRHEAALRLRHYAVAALMLLVPVALIAKQ